MERERRDGSCRQSAPSQTPLTPSCCAPSGLPARLERQRSPTPPGMDEPPAVPRLDCSPSAATSPKVLRSLIPLPGLWGWGGSGGGVRSNQSPSELSEVPLLLQLETWLSGREDKLLHWSQSHWIPIRKCSCWSLRRR